MLVLSRKRGQSLVIGDPESPDCIVLTIAEETTMYGTRIGVDAPDNIRVLRTEIVPNLKDADPKVRAAAKYQGIEC